MADRELPSFDLTLSPNLSQQSALGSRTDRALVAVDIALFPSFMSLPQSPGSYNLPPFASASIAGEGRSSESLDETLFRAGLSLSEPPDIKASQRLLSATAKPSWSKRAAWVAARLDALMTARA